MNASEQPRQFPLETDPVRYEVVRSRRRSFALHIGHNRVELRCPLRATRRELQEFLQENRGWVAKRLQEEALHERQRLRLEHGARIFYRAKEREIVLRPGRRAAIEVDDSRFIITGPGLSPTAGPAASPTLGPATGPTLGPTLGPATGPAAAPTAAASILQRHLIAEAQDYLPPRTEGLAKHLQVAHKLRAIKLRKTRSKWGHCTNDGVIQFNWLIMLAPFSIIDYLITHEVCHLIHPNHSPRYWRLVRSLCPQTPHYVRWLKKHEHRLWF